MISKYLIKKDFQELNYLHSVGDVFTQVLTFPVNLILHLVKDILELGGFNLQKLSVKICGLAWVALKLVQIPEYEIQFTD